MVSWNRFSWAGEFSLNVLELEVVIAVPVMVLKCLNAPKVEFLSVIVSQPSSLVHVFVVVSSLQALASSAEVLVVRYFQVFVEGSQ